MSGDKEPLVRNIRIPMVIPTHLHGTGADDATLVVTVRGNHLNPRTREMSTAAQPQLSSYKKIHDSQAILKFILQVKDARDGFCSSLSPV